MLDGRKGIEVETARSDVSDSIASSYWSASAGSRLATLESALSRTDPAGISGAYKQLDGEILALPTALSTFRTRRNALSPICCLPPETLVHIFSFDPTPDDGKPTYNLMHITHVCRRWRVVAIGCPSLWGRINLAVDPRWAREMLGRAKATPLSLFIERSQDKMTKDDVDLIVNRLHHIRDLRLINRNIDDTARSCKLHQRLTAPAPLLESFWLHISNADHEEWLTLSENIFDGHAPRLQQFKVDNLAYFPWQSPVLSGLVELSISLDSSSFSAPSHPLNDIFDAFERMPALRIVNPYSCLPQLVSHEQHNRVVDLTRLSQFTLFDDVCLSTQFMQCVRLSPGAETEIGLRCSMTRADDSIDAFFAVLVAHLGVSHCVFPRLEFYTDVGDSMLVHDEEPFAYVRIDAHRTLSEEDNAPLILYFHVDYALPKYANSTKVLETFCAMLPDNMDSVLRLDVHTGVDWTVDDWVGILSIANNLVEIHAASESTDTICDALGTVVEWKGDEDEHAFVCPQLSSLTLSFALLENLYPYPGQPPPLALRMPQSLEKRQRSGLQL
ncbi:hypothetical protein BV25DRAFT_1736937 [Artomyces pyxidatus]|uniref:Uncharacterized protein n=1 Tax=Artomyces pyxidatus TaxID=48021 RepID=A0ACB8SGW5_9AGAM|nr:hypothetical protein BV25DRAFT_1736937 [Artomyces pyxidatus]